ncbi:MAG: hypothetical protein WCY43_03475 [Patescibacteria group bacterium]|nr:hypothetical protein [Patescibacteria group bacterium]
MKNFFKKNSLNYCREFFYFLGKFLMLSFVLEIFLPGVILTYINLNIFLFLFLLFFMFLILFKNIDDKN